MRVAFAELKVFTGSAHPELAREIASHLGIPLGQARLTRFPDTEVSFQIDENIRGTDVFIVQPTLPPVDEHLVELLIMIDAFRRSSAARITAVIPYYGYARQDRKDKPRVPISAKLVANLLGAAGANRVLTMDLHKAQIQGFFDIPVDHLFAAPVIIDYLARQRLPNLTIVAPDAGGAERARAYAKRLGAGLAVVDKRRSAETGAAEVMNVIGDVEGRTCILQDDIVDTAGTMQKAASALANAGAKRVLASAVHGVLSGPALVAHRAVADREDARDQHDPGDGRPAALGEDRGPVGGAAVGAGHPQHPRGEFGVVVVRLGPSTSLGASASTSFGATRIELRYGSGPRSGQAGQVWQERGGADAARGPGPVGAVRRVDGRGREAGGHADRGVAQGAVAHPPLGVGREHAHHAEAGSRFLARDGEGVPAGPDHPPPAPRGLLPGGDGQDAARSRCRSCSAARRRA